MLSIFAPPLPPAERIEKHPSQNPEQREAAEEEYSMLMKFIRRWEKSLQSAVPNARILEWPGATHYLFLTHEAELLHELQVFLAGLH